MSPPLPRPKIVVITPVRNEAWILPLFLSTCSVFADHIIILDQASTDGGQEICRNFQKVTLLDNPSATFNEAERQTLLIEAARKLVSGPRFLLALDADEPMAADAVAPVLWETILSAPPGTPVCFQKIHFLEGRDYCLKDAELFAFGYLDDNQAHSPTSIHSRRVPPGVHKCLSFPDLHVLHYGLARHQHQLAKMRMYCCLEKVYKTSRWHWRRLFYSSTKDYGKDLAHASKDPQWVADWEKKGIDMAIPKDAGTPWTDIEVLHLFAKHGARSFWSEPIWDHDWEAARIKGQQEGYGDLPESSIQPPPVFYQKALKLADIGLRAARQWRRKLLGLS